MMMKPSTSAILAALCAAAPLATGCSAILGVDDFELRDGAVPPEDDPDASPDAAVCAPTELGSVTFQRIAPWRDDARAAYSIVHDGACSAETVGIQDLALPALQRRGFRAAVAPDVEACNLRDGWDAMRAAAAAGHEIANGGYSGDIITAANAAHEITEARAAFESQLERPVSFFVFPGNAYDAATVQAVKTAGHLGAMAGLLPTHDVNNPPINTRTDDDFAVAFDSWPQGQSRYRRYRVRDVLALHAVNAIETGGWAVRALHGVTDGDPALPGHGFGPISLDDYEAHIEFLATARDGNHLWVALPSEVIRYRHAAARCGASVDGERIVFDTSAADCVTYATPISVIVETGNDVGTLAAVQGDNPVSVLKLGPSTFSVTADPTRGEVTLGGCSNTGRSVEDVATPARPTEVTSVCEIEQGVGTGTDGRIDDFERPATELRLMPNPGQRDGRSGGWDAYPQNVTLESMTDGGSRVLHFASTQGGVFAGASVGFRGTSVGASACYDASEYQGVRFRIRGDVRVANGSSNADKVFVSLISAETQGRTYGGDLEGQGGQFTKQISVSTTWTSVSLDFADFDPPSWGDTIGLTQLAVRKLQALSFDVNNDAIGFDVYLDDIQLY